MSTDDNLIETDNYVSPDAAQLAAEPEPASLIEIDEEPARLPPPAPLVSNNAKISRTRETLLGGGIRGWRPEPARAPAPAPAPEQTADVASDLADIASESRRNANESSNIAGARNPVVGFNTAQGYADAAALAVTQATRDEYVAAARRGGIEVDVASLPPLPAQDKPVGAGIVHMPTGVPLFERPRSERAFKVGVAAQERALDIVPDESVGVRLQHGELVAGAAAEGHGILVGWSGKGDMLRSKLVQLADESGIPREWLPLPAEPAVQLTRAIKHVAIERGLDPKQEKAKERQVVEARKVDSRWFLATRLAQGGKVGTKFGDIVLVASLYGESLEFDSDSDADLCEAVRAKFDQLIASQRYVAGDITRWLIDVLKGRLQAVKYGGNYYVPRRHRATAERIVRTFVGADPAEPQWGTDWMEPPLPIASGAQLAAGLRNALVAEVDAVLGDLELQRAKAAEVGKTEVGEIARSNFIVRIRGVAKRVVAYSSLLGEQQLAACRRRLHEALVDIEKVDGGFSVERFDNIMEEIARDAALRGDGVD